MDHSRGIGLVSKNARRRTLATAICGILFEFGYKTVDNTVIETLIEIFQCFLIELGRMSKNYSELAGRTIPVVADVTMGLIEMGIPIIGIETYIRSGTHLTLPQIQYMQPIRQPSLLNVGHKQPLPNFMSSSLPQFPDSHAHVRTPTHKQPVTEYEAIREKAATQKRDIENALTKFIARTGITHNLFENNNLNIFPLIACKSHSRAYLPALLPQDQIFDPEELEYDPLAEFATQKKKIKTEPLDDSIKDGENGTEEYNVLDNIFC